MRRGGWPSEPSVLQLTLSSHLSYVLEHQIPDTNTRLCIDSFSREKFVVGSGPNTTNRPSTCDRSGAANIDHHDNVILPTWIPGRLYLADLA